MAQGVRNRTKTQYNAPFFRTKMSGKARTFVLSVQYAYLPVMRKREYRYEQIAVEVLFENRSVHIINNKDLWTLLENDTETRTMVLVTWIKEQYRFFFDKELEITEDSLAVELWGHVYFEYYILAVKELIRLQLIENFLERILKVSEVIDCGESGFDNNRKLWDMLAPHKSFILKMLPGKIDPDHLKREESGKEV